MLPMAPRVRVGVRVRVGGRVRGEGLAAVVEETLHRPGHMKSTWVRG